MRKFAIWGDMIDMQRLGETGVLEYVDDIASGILTNQIIPQMKKAGKHVSPLDQTEVYLARNQLITWCTFEMASVLLGKVPRLPREFVTESKQQQTPGLLNIIDRNVTTRGYFLPVSWCISSAHLLSASTDFTGQGFFPLLR